MKSGRHGCGSWLYHLVAMWPWARCFYSPLSFKFLAYCVQIIEVPILSGLVLIKQNRVNKELSMCLMHSKWLVNNSHNYYWEVWNSEKNKRLDCSLENRRSTSIFMIYLLCDLHHAYPFSHLYNGECYLLYLPSNITWDNVCKTLCNLRNHFYYSTNL